MYRICRDTLVHRKEEARCSGRSNEGKTRLRVVPRTLEQEEKKMEKPETQKNEEERRVPTFRARIFEVVSEQLTAERIEEVLESHKIISRYAWIDHNKDEYKKADERKNPEHKAGTLKASHHHIVMQLSTPEEIRIIAKWFDVPTNLVEVPKGRGDTFLDKVKYLTHESEKEQAKGKYLYPDEEVHANFDWRAALDALEMNKVKYGKKDVTPKERMRYAVLKEGKTLRECNSEDPLLFAEDMDKLKKLRGQYLMGCTPPACRINFFVQGSGGIGKGLLCRALARALFPNLTDDDEIFFIVGANGVGFEGYDGQPVIIWNDKRSYELVKMLGGVGNVFDVFDTFPTKSKQNVKYSSVNLINAVNIVNADQSYTDFLDGLAGEYTDRDGHFHKAEDKSQSYRRFPMMIVLHEEDYDMLINKGYMDNTRNFMEYYKYQHIRGNFAKINQKCHDKAIAQKFEAQTIAPVVEQHNLIADKLTKQVDDMAALEAEFADYGTVQDVKVQEIISPEEENRIDLAEAEKEYAEVTEREQKAYNEYGKDSDAWHNLWNKRLSLRRRVALAKWRIANNYPPEKIATQNDEYEVKKYLPEI